MKTEIVSAGGYRFVVRQDGRVIAQGERPPIVYCVLETADLDYALAFGRRRWRGEPLAARLVSAIDK